jgi:Flp pilus assembly protein TadD
MEQGVLGQAESEYREAARLKPDLPEPHVNLGRVLAVQGKWAAAAAELRRATEVKPDFPKGQSNYAWLLATCPQNELRNLSLAVTLAKRATELAPREGSYWNTLGVAQYRAGQWQAAIAALERSMALQNGGDAIDWLFLAMANWQLGHKGEARKWYTKATKWIDKNKSQDEDLGRIRAEARAFFEPKDQDAPSKPKTSGILP